MLGKNGPYPAALFSKNSVYEDRGPVIINNDIDKSDYYHQQDQYYTHKGTGVFAFRHNSSTWAAGEVYYLAMPSIMNPDKKQVSFDIIGTYPGEDNIIKPSNVQASISIGVIDSLKGFDTYSPIADYQLTRLEQGEIVKRTNNWLYDHIVVPLSDDFVGKQLVVVRTCETGSYEERYDDDGFGHYNTRNYTMDLYMDSLVVADKIGFMTPAIEEILPVGANLRVNWPRLGNNSWNIYVYDTCLSVLELPEKHIVKKITDIKDTVYTIQDLTPSSSYYVVLQVAGYGNALGTYSPRVVATTGCADVEVGKLFNFDDPAENKIIVGSYQDCDYSIGYFDATGKLGVHSIPDCWITGAVTGNYTSYADNIDQYITSYIPFTMTPTGSLSNSSNGAAANSTFAKSDSIALVFSPCKQRDPFGNP